jgi:hypothetical protein
MRSGGTARRAPEEGDGAEFADWLLSRVVLVGIQAPSRDSGLRIVESMNDRGARLTPVDLLKSFRIRLRNMNELAGAPCSSTIVGSSGCPASR